MFTAPPVTIGQIVLWRQDLTSPPAPGIVTQVHGPNSIRLSVATPNDAVFKIKDGVRHKDDPEWEKAGNKRNGLWEYNEKDRLEASNPKDARKHGKELVGAK